MTPGIPAHPPTEPRPPAHLEPAPRPTPLPPTPESWLPNEHGLYRPRHSPRQRTALVSAIVFFLAPALAFVFGVRAEPFENRKLHELPRLADGWEFFTGLPAWATDHLPLREAGVAAASAVSSGVFGDPPGAQSGARSGPVGVQPRTGREEPATPRELYPTVVVGPDNWLYLGEDITGKCFPVLDVDGVIRALNRLRHAVEDSGRRFELVIAPDKTTAMPRHLPDDYLGEDCAKARAQEFWSRVPAATGAIDLRPALSRASEELGVPIYDSMDSHWTFAGGLTMTRVLAERISPGSTETWKIGSTGRRSWPADLPRLFGRSEDRRLPTFSLAPDGTEDKTRYVASDFRMPLQVRQFGPPARGTFDGTVGVVADSFTQFASPFLTAANRDLTIVHADTVAQSSPDRVAELLADRDVVVFEFVERMVAGGGSALLRDDTIEAITRALARHPR